MQVRENHDITTAATQRHYQLFSELLECTQVSQAEYAARRKITVAAAGTYFKHLRYAGWIEEGERVAVSGFGRPTIFYKLARTRNATLVICTLGTEVFMACTDFTGAIIDISVMDLDGCSDQNEVGLWALAAAKRFCKSASESGRPVRVVCGAIAGEIAADGAISYSSPFPFLNGFNLQGLLQKKLRLPCKIVPLMFAEHMGIPDEFLQDDSLLVSLSWDLGIGLLVSRGAKMLHDCIPLDDWLPGFWEFGHTLAVPGGLPCSCGKRGCIEAHAGGRHILDSLNRGTRGVPSLLEAAREGDPQVITEVRTAASLLGRHLGRTLVLVQPRRLILTGSLSPLWPLIKQEFCEGLAQSLDASAIEKLGIVPVLNERDTLILGTSRIAVQSVIEV